MRTLVLCCALIGALGLAACKGKDKTAASGSSGSEAQRKAAQNEARLLASDADFAVQLRDFGRAEASLAKAAELMPEDYSIWVGLGMARRKLGNKDGARTAYQRGFDALEQTYKAHADEPGILITQIEILLLLDRPADARKLCDRMLREHANHPRVKAFVSGKEFEAMLNNPDLRSNKV
jgi:Flp pilus assembly protein TadD